MNSSDVTSNSWGTTLSIMSKISGAGIKSDLQLGGAWSPDGVRVGEERGGERHWRRMVHSVGGGRGPE